MILAATITGILGTSVLVDLLAAVGLNQKSNLDDPLTTDVKDAREIPVARQEVVECPTAESTRASSFGTSKVLINPGVPLRKLVTKNEWRFPSTKGERLLRL